MQKKKKKKKKKKKNKKNFHAVLPSSRDFKIFKKIFLLRMKETDRKDFLKEMYLCK